MNLFYDDFDRRFLAEIKRQEEAEARVRITADELAELRKKARMYDILTAASKREIDAIWDAANATGCQIEPMIDALGRRIL